MYAKAKQNEEQEIGNAVTFHLEMIFLTKIISFIKNNILFYFMFFFYLQIHHALPNYRLCAEKRRKNAKIKKKIV